MIQLQLTDEQSRVLGEAPEPVELLNSRGRVVARIQPQWTREEIEEAAQRSAENPLPADISATIARLKQTHPIPAS